MENSISSSQGNLRDRPTKKITFTAEELRAIIDRASKEKERDLLKPEAQRNKEIKAMSAAPEYESQIINYENLLANEDNPGSGITFDLPEDMVADSDDTRRIYKFSA